MIPQSKKDGVWSVELVLLSFRDNVQRPTQLVYKDAFAEPLHVATQKEVVCRPKNAAPQRKFLHEYPPDTQAEGGKLLASRVSRKTVSFALIRDRMPPYTEQVIGDIERASSLSQLAAILQKVAEDCGYSGFSFVDAPRLGLGNPTVINTIRSAFEADYRAEGLLAVDPMIPVMRRTNMPFTWESVKLPPRLGRRLPGAHKTMHVAHDHGYREGLVVPVHYVDRLGRPYSSVVTFFWTEKIELFPRVSEATRNMLHLIVLYWAQRVIDLVDKQRGRPSRMAGENEATGPTLTDREREVLAWAAVGKTVQDTADILSISSDTAETHIRSAMKKLGANNKTHAVARAIFLGLIDG